MHPDAFLLLVLTVLAVGAIPVLVWYKAQKKIRQLEMTLMAQDIEANRNDDLRSLIQQVAEQVEVLADGQAQLARRLNERIEAPQLPPPAPVQAVTPH